jgi:hypothetical protein
MHIHREKFLALTATLAGFWSNSACTIKLDGLSVSATLDLTTTTAGETTLDTTSTTGGTGDVTSEGGSDGTQGGTGTTGTSTTAPTTTSPTTGATTGGTTGGSGTDCCTPHNTPGCDDTTIQQCVCNQDPVCCGDERGVWDSICVAEVNQFGCGMCEIDTGGDTTGEGEETGGSTTNGSGSSGTGG